MNVNYFWIDFIQSNTTWKKLKYLMYLKGTCQVLCFQVQVQVQVLQSEMIQVQVQVQVLSTWYLSTKYQVQVRTWPQACNHPMTH